MLSILLSWCYVLIVSFVYGCVTLNWAKYWLKIEAEQLPPLAVVAVIGLEIISVLTAYLSLIMGIGLWANSLILSLAVLLSILEYRLLTQEIQRMWQNLQKNEPTYSLFLAVLITVVALRTSLGEGLLHYDTGLYHASSVRWIEQYGVVPGLGNLFAPLAVDSLWFQPQALFSFSFILNHPLHALNGWIICLGIIFAISGIKYLLSSPHNLRFSYCAQGLMLLALIEPINQASSASTDEPTAILIMMIVVLFLRYLEQSNENQSTKLLAFILIFLSLFAFLVKLSAFPILLLPIYINYDQIKSRDKMFLPLTIATSILLILPKLIRTVILSGYLIYPLPNLDLFSFDWKMPLDVVIAEKQAIEGWARIPFRPPNQVLEGNISTWFPTWFGVFQHTAMAVWLVIALGLFLLGVILYFNEQYALIQRYFLAYSLVIVGSVFWFLQAPFIRFGYGFLWSWVILSIAPLVHWLLRKYYVYLTTAKNYKFSLTVAATLLLIVIEVQIPHGSLGMGIELGGSYIRERQKAHLLWQQDYPTVDVVAILPDPHYQGKLRIYQPRATQLCWSTTLPCSPYMQHRAQLRASDLQAGFRPITDSATGFQLKPTVDIFKTRSKS